MKLRRNFLLFVGFLLMAGECFSLTTTLGYDYFEDSTTTTAKKASSENTRPPKVSPMNVTTRASEIPVSVNLSTTSGPTRDAFTRINTAGQTQTTATTRNETTKAFITGTTPAAVCFAVIYPIDSDPLQRTIQFKRTMAGLMAQAQCPNNPRKLATWRCTNNGWSRDVGQPDLSDCVSTSVASLLDEVNSQLTIARSARYNDSVDPSVVIGNVANKMENITATERQTFLAGDLVKIAFASNTIAPQVVGFRDVSAAKSMLHANSNLMSLDIRSVWYGLPKKERGTTLSQLLGSTEDLSFVSTAVRKQTNQGLVVQQTSPRTTEANKTLSTESFDVSIIPVIKNSPLLYATFGSENSSGHIAVNMPSTLINRLANSPSVASVIVYNSLHSQVENLLIGIANGTVFNSPIFTVALGDNTGESMGRVLLPEYFEFSAAHRYSDADKYESVCSYYDEGYGLWLQRGCHQVSKNKTHTVCACDHLTTFAILIDFTGQADITDDDNTNGNNSKSSQLPPEARKALFEISIIGCALSIVALFVFVLIVAIISRQNKTLRVIYCSFGGCLLVAEIIFLAGADKVHTEGCVAVGVLLHFFFTATFMWSGAIAFYFILVIYGAEPLNSREQAPRWPYFMFGCYFISATLVGATWITSSANGETAYGSDKYCWMNLPYTWFFISPVAFILVFNFGVLAAVAAKACCSKLNSTYTVQAGDQSPVQIVCRAMLGITWTMLILCATWVLGFFFVSTGSQVVQFIFVVVNSFQGVLVLVFYIVTNRQFGMDFALFSRRQSWLPDSIRTWASYKVSSLSSTESWRYQEGSNAGSSSRGANSNSGYYRDSAELASFAKKP